jgi:hypothetical protein
MGAASAKAAEAEAAMSKASVRTPSTDISEDG